MSAPRRKMKKCRLHKKRMYRDKIAAMFAVASAQAKDSSTRGKLEKRVYYSAPCRSWHSTSQTEEEYQSNVISYYAKKADFESVESGTTDLGES